MATERESDSARDLPGGDEERGGLRLWGISLVATGEREREGRSLVVLANWRWREERRRTGGDGESQREREEANWRWSRRVREERRVRF